LIGLDIGGTKTAIVEGTAAGTIVQRRELPTEATRPFEAIWPSFESAMIRTIAQARRAGRDVIGVSIAIGGPLDIEQGILFDPPHLPGWHGTALRAHIASRFPDLPVYVEHDGNAGALAEYRFGVGTSRPALRHLIFLTFGTGLGAGLILKGALLRGASDCAGEIGHWRLSHDGPIGYGKAGSFEGYASGAGLIELAYRRHPGRWSRATPTRDLVEAMLADDPEALEVAAEAGEWLGRGLSLLIDALNPEVIVLGTLGVVLGERVLRSARAVIAAEALPRATRACEILPAALGGRLGDVAALMAALDHSHIRQLLGSAA
jgi:glucokinase